MLPSAFVRPLGGNPGFGAAVNEVLRLVEGDNGFFLLCHDDIAPEPSAVRALVAEIFRSNAGIVGPKLVEWSEPRRLQHVGLGLDPADLPASECLKDTVERFMPVWNDEIAPAVKSGRRVLIAAHGNSLRALVEYLDGISDEDIPKLNIPTGVPLV